MEDREGEEEGEGGRGGEIERGREIGGENRERERLRSNPIIHKGTV